MPYVSQAQIIKETLDLYHTVQLVNLLDFIEHCT